MANEPGCQWGSEHAAEQDCRDPPCVPGLNRNPRLAATAMTTSLVSIDPITFRGSRQAVAGLVPMAISRVVVVTP